MDDQTIGIHNLRPQKNPVSFAPLKNNFRQSQMKNWQSITLNNNQTVQNQTGPESTRHHQTEKFNFKNCNYSLSLFTKVRSLSVQNGPYDFAPKYLQLPLRQWGAGNVYLLVLSKAKR